MIAIGIVVPIYNCAPYLAECLHSIKEQSFTDFKVILVDDGSTDLSGQICKSFCSVDERFMYCF